MKNTRLTFSKALFAGFFMVFCAANVSAGVMSLVPSSTIVTIGDSFDIDLVWDGTEDSTANPLDPFAGLLGAFDVDIDFDTSRVAFASGDCVPAGSFFCFVGLSFFDPSVVDAAEIFVSPAVLGPASIARMTFDTGNGLATGIANFSIDQTDLFLYIGDFFGDPYPFPVTFNSASVCIDDTAGTICQVPVPIPGSLPLMLLGLLGLAAHQRQRRLA